MPLYIREKPLFELRIVRDPSISPVFATNLPKLKKPEQQDDGDGDSDSDREDDLFDDHVPTRELAAMSIDSSKPPAKGKGKGATTAAATKKKSSTASTMSFSERVKSRFGDTSTPAPTVAVRFEKGGRPRHVFIAPLLCTRRVNTNAMRRNAMRCNTMRCNPSE